MLTIPKRENIWQFENSIFEGPDSGGIQLFDSVGYYATIVSDADDKGDAGFNITITDVGCHSSEAHARHFC